MTELLTILFFSFLFTTFFYVPYYRFIILGNKENSINLIDKNILNILVLGNFILTLSFFDITLSTIIKLFYLFTGVTIFIFWREYKIAKKEFFYYLFFFTILIFFLTVDLAYNLTLYWDAQKFWLPKAIHFYNNEGLSGLENISKPEYPYFGSLIWAFFWKLSNLSNEYIGRIFYNILLCYSLYNIVDLLKTSNLKKLIFFVILLLVVYDYWHIRGSQEILVFSFLLICSKHLFSFTQEKKINKVQLLILFLSLNLLIWTKNEGIIFGSFILLTLLFFSELNLKFKTLTLLIFLFFLLNRFFIFDIYGFTNKIADSDDFDLQNLFNSIVNNFSFYNFYFITKNFLISSIKFPYIIISLFFMTLLIIKENFKEKNLFIFFYLIINVIFTYLVYFSSTPRFELMILTSLNRFMFESSAPYLLFFIIYLKKTMKV